MPNNICRYDSDCSVVLIPVLSALGPNSTMLLRSYHIAEFTYKKMKTNKNSSSLDTQYECPKIPDVISK